MEVSRVWRMLRHCCILSWLLLASIVTRDCKIVRTCAPVWLYIPDHVVGSAIWPSATIHYRRMLQFSTQTHEDHWKPIGKPVRSRNNHTLHPLNVTSHCKFTGRSNCVTSNAYPAVPANEFRSVPKENSHFHLHLHFLSSFLKSPFFLFSSMCARILLCTG